MPPSWVAASIVGNFEAAGALVIVPYAFDFVIKALHRLPSKGWWGEYNRADDKLYCPQFQARGPRPRICPVRQGDRRQEEKRGGRPQFCHQGLAEQPSGGD